MVLLVALLAWTVAARAAGPERPGSGWGGVAIAGNAAHAVAGALGSVWNGLTSLVTPAQLTDALPDQMSDDDRIFFAALETIGLHLTDVVVPNGLFSHPTYRFVATRDPSDGDIERTERRLLDYRDAASGPRARARQRIIRSVLDIAGHRRFMLTSVEIELWPWPGARFVVTSRYRRPEVVVAPR